MPYGFNTDRSKYDLTSKVDKRNLTAGYSNNNDLQGKTYTVEGVSVNANSYADTTLNVTLDNFIPISANAMTSSPEIFDVSVIAINLLYNTVDVRIVNKTGTTQQGQAYVDVVYINKALLNR